MKTLLLVLVVCCFAGCTTTPTVDGGKSSVKLSGGTESELSQGDNPETPSTQRTSKKKITRKFAPMQFAQATLGTGKSAESGQASEPVVVPDPVKPTLVEEIEEVEESETVIGSTQDVATIVEAAKSYKDFIFSILVAAALVWLGVFQWRREYWVAAVNSFTCAGISVYTSSPVWGLGSFLLSCALFMGYKLYTRLHPAANAFVGK